MKQLCSSADFRELAELLKRLLSVGIPCAVCKDPSNSQLSLWIQRENDFPLALKMSLERKAPRPAPPWACLIDRPQPAAEDAAAQGEEPAVPAAEGRSEPSVVVVATRGRTRTGSVTGMG